MGRVRWAVLCLSALLMGLAFVVAAMSSSPEGIAAPLSPKPGQAGSPVAPSELPRAPVTGPSGLPMDTPGPESPPGPSSLAEDPCAAARAELEAERATRELADEKLAALKTELLGVLFELKRAQFPPVTPYGAFLASPEAEQILAKFPCTLSPRRTKITFPHPPSFHPDGSREIIPPYWIAHKDELRVFTTIQWILEEDQLPVFLLPGEALWIAERSFYGDWLEGEGYEEARSSDEAIILFLGPDRLAAELPAKRFAELRAEWDGMGLFD